MKLRGTYMGSAVYAPGDIVIYTDDKPYIKLKESKKGIRPHDTLYWSQLDPTLFDAVIIMAGVRGDLTASQNDVADNVNNVLPGFMSGAWKTKELCLKSSTANSTKKFKITVTDDGVISATEA